MRERLKLVTDFAELRAGMIVVLKGCPACSSTHRVILTSERAPANSTGADGKTSFIGGWNFEPPLSCEGRWGSAERAFIAPGAVINKKLYRVLDGLESNTASRVTQKLTKKPQRIRP